MTGCCWTTDRSCVRNEATAQTCVDLPAENTVCLSDDAPLDPPSSPVCGAELHYESCAMLGFTMPCDGYAVRPGARCG
jgi:hypothetical protein